MTKIMFVCHGNICRSPMAEFIFKDLIKKHKKENEFFVLSSATSREELGNDVYPPAKRQLLKHGILCDGKFATQLKKEDYNNFDLFVCMDENNVRNALKIFNFDPENKVKKLLEFAGVDRDVSDPWYSLDFDTAYNDILLGCTALFDELSKNG